MKVYRYLTGPDDSAFCHRVSEALNKGWQLHGGPALTYDAERKQVIAGQAVVKDVDDKEYVPGMDLSAQ